MDATGGGVQRSCEFEGNVEQQPLFEPRPDSTSDRGPRFAGSDYRPCCGGQRPRPRNAQKVNLGWGEAS